MPHTLTNEQIETEIAGLQGHFSENRNRMSAMELQRFIASGPDRISATERLAALTLEAARRGILGDLRDRFKSLRMVNGDSDVVDLLINQREWVAKRGFLHDVRLVEVLEELLAFRRSIHRQVLTGEDEIREYETWRQQMVSASPEDRAQHFRHGQVRGSFLAGLRQGFALRGEPIE